MKPSYMKLDRFRAIRANRVCKDMKDVIASNRLPSCSSGEGSEAPASPRQVQPLQGTGRGGAISFFA